MMAGNVLGGECADRAAGVGVGVAYRSLGAKPSRQLQARRLRPGACTSTTGCRSASLPNMPTRPRCWTPRARLPGRALDFHQGDPLHRWPLWPPFSTLLSLPKPLSLVPLSLWPSSRPPAPSTMVVPNSCCTFKAKFTQPLLPAFTVRPCQGPREVRVGWREVGFHQGLSVPFSLP